PSSPSSVPCAGPSTMSNVCGPGPSPSQYDSVISVGSASSAHTRRYGTIGAEFSILPSPCHASTVIESKARPENAGPFTPSVKNRIVLNGTGPAIWICDPTLWPLTKTSYAGAPTSTSTRIVAGPDTDVNAVAAPPA